MILPRRLVIISDVGGEDRRHVGDEAMFEANLDGFRRLIPGVVFTAVSPDSGIATRYGIDSVPSFGFSDEPLAALERNAVLERILAEALHGGDEGTATEAIRNCDGLIISGGGNLSSSWPDLLYERVALLQLARIFNKPAVILGQTIGPMLSAADRRLLAGTLPYARFIGARELPTAAFLQALGVPAERIWYQCDDAMFLEDGPTLRSEGALAIAATIDPQVRAAGGQVFEALVIQLRELLEGTGARLILVPHEFSDEATHSDLAEARLLAERIGLSRVEIADGLTAGEAKRVAGDADLVISTRYHPIVFGLAGGAPAIGIYADEYCRIKLQGALAHAGLERWTLNYGDVANGHLLSTALELWSIRNTVRDNLMNRRGAWREELAQRWNAILRALDSTATIPALPSTMFGSPLAEVAPAIASALDARREAMARQWAGFERLSMRFAELERYAISLQEELGPRRTLTRWWAAALRRVKGGR